MAGKPNQKLKDEFQIFWKVYPNKKGKFEAERWWLKYKPELSEVLAKLELQKQEKKWLKNNGKFVPEWPYGSTYVHQRRWEDDFGEEYQKYLNRKKYKALAQRREREEYIKNLREEWQPYLESKTTQALIDIKKDGGHLAGLCGWLIDEIIEKRKR